MVEAEFARIREGFSGHDQELLTNLEQSFTPPTFVEGSVDSFDAHYRHDPVFRS